MAPFKSTQSFSVGHFLKTFRDRDAVGPAALNSPVRTDRTPKLEATGGAIAIPGNGYKYHFLTANPHTFIITVQPGAEDVEYIVVGGGGAGGTYPGGNSGGGGGAGGFVTGTFPNMAVGTYPVTIGQGGAALSNPGTSTTFNSIIGYGGGGGSPAYGNPGNPGASGGGGGGNGPTTGGIANRIQPDGSTNIPSPLSPQGNIGGTGGPSSNTGKSGGGGGAGGPGGNAGTNSGAGGVGKVAFSGDTGVPTDYGTPGPSAGRWFAGGGAGGGYPTTDEDTGPGGAGGGGSSLDGLSLNGVDGTGGGGGGNQGPSAGDGGNGIVILRYAV
tara:strand:+ start:591 stop:1571 length:981 start_codon:yes stop_codon:yes gene_type:complete